MKTLIDSYHVWDNLALFCSFVFTFCCYCCCFCSFALLGTVVSFCYFRDCCSFLLFLGLLFLFALLGIVVTFCSFGDCFFFFLLFWGLLFLFALFGVVVVALVWFIRLLHKLCCVVP